MADWWELPLARGGIYLGEEYARRRVGEAYREATSPESMTPVWMKLRLGVVHGFWTCLMIGLVSGVICFARLWSADACPS